MEKILLSNSELVYHGTDLSSTMVKPAQARLQHFGGRATAVLADSTVGIELSNSAADRFVSTYVFDLMSTLEIHSLLAEAVAGPLSSLKFVEQTKWRVLHVSQAPRFGLTSEVLVAESGSKNLNRLIYARLGTSVISPDNPECVREEADPIWMLTKNHA